MKRPWYDDEFWIMIVLLLITAAIAFGYAGYLIVAKNSLGLFS